MKGSHHESPSNALPLGVVPTPEHATRCAPEARERPSMNAIDELAVPPENVGFLNFKTISLSAVKSHKPCTLLQAARHNLRQIQAELGANSRIDARRMGENRILAGPETAAEVVAMADKLKAQLEKPPTRRDAVQAVEAVFSLNRKTQIDVAAYFARCLDWVSRETRLPVLLATVHQDEEHPHLHVLLAPFRDGRYVGGELTVKAKQEEMRDRFNKQVAAPAGLKRGGGKYRGQVKKWAVAAVLRECEAMGLPAANGPLWGLLRATIERDPTEAVGLLKINVNSIRPRADLSGSNSIGFEPNSIGIGFDPLKDQTLTCVGIGSPAPPNGATKAPQAMPPTVARQAGEVLASVVPVPNKPLTANPRQSPVTTTERLSAAHAAMQAGYDRHARKPTAKPLAWPAERHVDRDGCDPVPWG